MSRIQEKKVKTKKKNKHIKLKIFIIILILLVMGSIVIAKRLADLDGNWVALLMGHNEKTLDKLDKIYILVMGESTGLSDTMIVCSYDPKTQEGSMLSIPRDTFVGNSKSNAGASDKLNSQYKNGTKPENTLKEINELTGLNITNYILVDTKALVELVDLIGGIEFDVPRDMNYDDADQDLHINLKAGYQKLDGKQVEGLVRFRHNNDGSSYSYEYGNEDYGRMKTQRAVITTIAKQTLKVKNVKELNNILDLVKKYVQTNMNFSILKDYIPYAIEMDMGNIESEQLPGESKRLNGIWFFLNDKEKTTEIVNRLFLKKTDEQNSTNIISTEQ